MVCKDKFILYIDIKKRTGLDILFQDLDDYSIIRYFDHGDAINSIRQGLKYDLAIVHPREEHKMHDEKEVMGLSRQFNPNAKVICVSGAGITRNPYADFVLSPLTKPEQVVSLLENYFRQYNSRSLKS